MNSATPIRGLVTVCLIRGSGMEYVVVLGRSRKAVMLIQVLGCVRLLGGFVDKIVRFDEVGSRAEHITRVSYDALDELFLLAGLGDRRNTY